MSTEDNFQRQSRRRSITCTVQRTWRDGVGPKDEHSSFVVVMVLWQLCLNVFSPLQLSLSSSDGTSSTSMHRNLNRFCIDVSLDARACCQGAQIQKRVSSNVSSRIIERGGGRWCIWHKQHGHLCDRRAWCFEVQVRLAECMFLP